MKYEEAINLIRNSIKLYKLQDQMNLAPITEEIRQMYTAMEVVANRAETKMILKNIGGE